MKFLTAGIAALAMTAAFATAAHAATFQSQALDNSAAGIKQDGKKRGPLKSLFTDVITNYDLSGPPSAPDKYATNTKVYFPTDYVFNAKGLSQCQNTPAFAGGNQANAIALCGAAKVSSAGSGTLSGAAPGVTAKVTAFNGVPSGGSPTLLLHSESSAGANLVLVGTLKPSNVAGYGRMLDVPVDLGPFQGVEAITDFRVTIPRVKLPFPKSQKKRFAKQRGKCKKVSSKGKRKKCLANVNSKEKTAKQSSYIMARCSKGTWNFRADSTYNTGAPTQATDSVSCNRIKPKKKKKKK